MTKKVVRQMNWLAGILVLTLALIGFVRCMEAVVMWLTRDARGVWLIPVSQQADVEYVAWCVAMRRRWRRGNVYLVDMGLDAAGHAAAQRLGVEVIAMNGKG